MAGYWAEVRYVVAAVIRAILAGLLPVQPQMVGSFQVEVSHVSKRSHERVTVMSLWHGY